MVVRRVDVQCLQARISGSRQDENASRVMRTCREVGGVKGNRVRTSISLIVRTLSIRDETSTLNHRTGMRKIVRRQREQTNESRRRRMWRGKWAKMSELISKGSACQSGPRAAVGTREGTDIVVGALNGYNSSLLRVRDLRPRRQPLRLASRLSREAPADHHAVPPHLRGARSPPFVRFRAPIKPVRAAPCSWASNRSLLCSVTRCTS